MLTRIHHNTYILKINKKCFPIVALTLIKASPACPARAMNTAPNFPKHLTIVA